MNMGALPHDVGILVGKKGCVLFKVRMQYDTDSVGMVILETLPLR